MDKKYELLKTQRNEIFSLIQQAGLNPREFEWTTHVFPKDNDMKTYPKLVHMSSEFYFIFINDERNEGFYYNCSPGKNIIKERGYNKSWYSQRSQVQIWINTLKTEVQSPDLWLHSDETNNFIAENTNENLSNELFSKEEQKTIAKSLVEIKEFLLTLSQTSEKSQKTIEKQFQYLQESSNRLGKKDWLNNFLGVVLAYLLNGIIPPEKFSEFLTFSLHSLNNIYNAIKTLPYIKIS